MAPEVLDQGRISRASDVYAFGILLYELYSGRSAFKGAPRAMLGYEVVKLRRRPQFPVQAPPEYQNLAVRCWAADPAQRPGFDAVVAELEAMRRRLTPDGGSLAPACADAGGGGGGGAFARLASSSGDAASAQLLAAAGASAGALRPRVSSGGAPAPAAGGALIMSGSRDSASAATALVPMPADAAAAGGGGVALRGPPVRRVHFGADPVAAAPLPPPPADGAAGADADAPDAAAGSSRLGSGGVSGVSFEPSASSWPAIRFIPDTETGDDDDGDKDGDSDDEADGDGDREAAGAPDPAVAAAASDAAPAGGAAARPPGDGRARPRTPPLAAPGAAAPSGSVSTPNAAGGPP